MTGGRSRVVVAIRVGVAPGRAFDVFTRDIALWWVHNDLFRFTPKEPGALAFVPPAGDKDGGAEEAGRLIERRADGRIFEIGAVRVWEPGARLVVGWRQATFGPDHDTEVEVRFEPVGPAGEETRVTVEHRGWDSVPQAHVARHGFPLNVFMQHQAAQWRAGLNRLQALTS
ncbi:MAG: SRPBCC domain-containing protein [Hyphomonadaceae bacterium]